MQYLTLSFRQLRECCVQCPCSLQVICSTIVGDSLHGRMIEPKCALSFRPKSPVLLDCYATDHTKEPGPERRALTVNCTARDHSYVCALQNILGPRTLTAAAAERPAEALLVQPLEPRLQLFRAHRLKAALDDRF